MIVAVGHSHQVDQIPHLFFLDYLILTYQLEVVLYSSQAKFDRVWRVAEDAVVDGLEALRLLLVVAACAEDFDC